MNPSKEYWGDIISESAAEKRLSAIGEEDIEKLYLEKGNGILASMGTLGRDFFEAISEFDAEEHTFFQEPGQDSLLSCLQSDILNLIHRKKNITGAISLKMLTTRYNKFVPQPNERD